MLFCVFVVVSIVGGGDSDAEVGDGFIVLVGVLIVLLPVHVDVVSVVLYFNVVSIL